MSTPMVRDPRRDVLCPILPCRSCAQPVYFGFSELGKRVPFEIDEAGEPTRVNHFSKCPDGKRWRKKRNP